METPSITAVGLVGAAAAALAPAPSDPAERSRWMVDLTSLATALYRPAQVVEGHLQVLADCRPVRGVILEAKPQVGNKGPTGRGLVVIRPTMGEHANDPDATEPMRTPWLNEPRGAALLAQAQALVGVECWFGKWTDAVDAKRKRGMVEWIEPLAATAAAARPPAAEPRQVGAAPAPARTPQAAAAPSGPPPHDIGTLRNISLGNHDHLYAAARDHLRMDREAVGLVEIELYGPAGAQSAVALRRIWNELINRSLQAA